jgi:hypothetical protein
MSLEIVCELEKRLDREITELHILHQPFRRTLSALHVCLHGAATGSKPTSPHLANEEQVSAITLRLSYVMPLAATCPAEPLDVDLVGFPNLTAMSRGILEPWFLLQYGHFCQFMPEVHRGYYRVEGGSPKDIALYHASAEFANQEARDVILTDLSLAHGEAPPASLWRQFDKLTSKGPPYDQRLGEELLHGLMAHWTGAILQAPFSTDQGFAAATGATQEEFRKFQAAAISIADYGRGITRAIDRRIKFQRDRNTDSLVKEMYNWVTVCWPEARIFQLLCQLTHLPHEPIERLMRFFVWDFSEGREGYQQFGDGFTPPFTRVGDHLLFSPEILRRFVTFRNVLFALNRRDRATFDNMLSCQFEPALVEAAQRMFSRHDGLQLVPNVRWRQRGEFDLLVFSERENVALHLQAKACLPPQGARMVQATERRLEEGLRQLSTFRALPPAEADQVLSVALRRKVHGVHVVDALLSSSSLGTDRIWSQLGGVVPLNPALLSLVLRTVREPLRLSLRQFPRLVHDEMRRLYEIGKPEWIHKEWVFPGANIWVPMLDYDVEAISRERSRAAEGHLWFSPEEQPYPHLRFPASHHSS